ncbi:MAG: TolC family protein [Desulfobacterales bacterium]|jgi:outer membrane protein TolC|nr:TolC family protein [Desulfobacterales bacterium]
MKQLGIGFQIALLTVIAGTAIVFAQPSSPPLTLPDAVELALTANLGIKRSQEEINAAEAARNASRTGFLPSLGTSYTYLHRNDERTTRSPVTGLATVALPQDQYTWNTSLRQPIFTGFKLLNEYRLSELGLDRAEVEAKLTRQDVILDAKNAYYTVLKTLKLLDVAEQQVTSIAAQRDVAENFYKVGLSPLNDLLQAQVQLANAVQRRTVAINDLEIARAQLNTVLRRPVNTPVALVDDAAHATYRPSLEECLEEAQKNRLEIRVANLDVDIAERQVKLTEKDYFPSVDLVGSYVRIGDDWQVDGGVGISDAAGWNIQATATWSLWEWGRTGYGRKEKLSRMAQSRYRRSELLDTINLQVKQAYLRTKEAEQNIATVEQAVEQAKENLRITEEQYKEQVATQTDVLVAQTLLTQTETNFTNALFDFKIAKAFLLRAIGQETLE